MWYSVIIINYVKLYPLWGLWQQSLRKTVILCAPVYLLVIMLMILGLRWWQMMAMKDFQIWVLATCSLPSMPALDMLDRSHFQPISFSLSAQPHSCSRTPDWEVSQPAPGNSAPLVSTATPTQSCWGSRGNHGGCKEVKGVGCHPNSSRAALKVPCLLSLPVHSPSFHPHTRENLRMPGWGCSESQDLEQFTGLWLENLQGLQCTVSDTLSVSYKHLIVTLKGVKASGCVLKGNADWIFKERFYRRTLQAAGLRQTHGLWVLPVLIFCLGKPGIID